MHRLNQTRITIDRIKIAPFLSEETLAFSARVLLDGKPFASARNAGHGGSTDVLQIDTRPATHHLFTEAEAYCKSLPAEVWTFQGEELQTAWNLGSVVDHLAADYEFERKVRASFNRMMRNYVAYESDGAIYQIKRRKEYGPANIAAIEKSVLQKHADAILLHLVPIDTAYAIYKRICTKE